MNACASKWFFRAATALLLLAPGCASKLYMAGAPLAQDSLAVGEPGLAPEQPPEPGVATSDPGPGGEPETAARLIVYNATLHLVVPDVPGTLDRLAAMASELKGYMQEMSSSSILLRIPSARFNESLQAVSALGEVTRREIKADDVSERMLDLRIRLKNMEQVRERLLKLLEKGDKVEDLLKVSQELERVTEAIELFKGKIQHLQSQVAFSTLRIQLNAVLPATEQIEVFPFEWVRRLGTEVASARTNLRPDSRFFPWLRFDLPPAYVKLQEGDDSTRAMSGEGVMLLVKREENFEGGTTEFWSQIVRRWLTSNGVVAIAEQKETVLDTGAKGVLFIGNKTFGRKNFTYWLAVFVRDDEVYTFECWGLSDNIRKDRDGLEKTLRSLRIKP